MRPRSDDRARTAQADLPPRQKLLTWHQAACHRRPGGDRRSPCFRRQYWPFLAQRVGICVRRPHQRPDQSCTRSRRETAGAGRARRRDALGTGRRSPNRASSPLFAPPTPQNACFLKWRRRQPKHHRCVAHHYHVMRMGYRLAPVVPPGSQEGAHPPGDNGSLSSITRALERGSIDRFAPGTSMMSRYTRRTARRILRWAAGRK